MAQYPNNYRTGVGYLPYLKYGGIQAYFTYNATRGTSSGAHAQRFMSDVYQRQASTPDGYGMSTPFPPVKAGSMGASNTPAVAITSASANMLSATMLDGNPVIATLAGSSDLSMIVSLDGSAPVVTITTPSANLSMTVNLDGTATITIDSASAQLSMIVPFEGTASVVQFGPGSTDLKGILSLAGDFNAAEALAPSTLAQAVWAAATSSNNNAGSMGAQLQDAYQAKVWMADDNSGLTDRYLVVWHKNGQPVTSGITSPQIQIIKASDGTDLIAASAMTQIATTGLFKYEDSSNRIANGSNYIAKVTATIGGATRTWYQPVSRDS